MNTATASFDRLLRFSETARRLGVSVSTVKRYIEKGLLRTKRLPSGHRRVYESSVRECLGE